MHESVCRASAYTLHIHPTPYTLHPTPYTPKVSRRHLVVTERESVRESEKERERARERESERVRARERERERERERK